VDVNTLYLLALAAYTVLCLLPPNGRCRTCGGYGIDLRGYRCARCDGTGRRPRMGRRIARAVADLHRTTR
jgi:hypothetical protein